MPYTNTRFMKTKSCHDIFVVTGGNTGCYDNLRCRQWRQSSHHGKSRFCSVRNIHAIHRCTTQSLSQQTVDIDTYSYLAMMITTSRLLPSNNKEHRMCINYGLSWLGLCVRQGAMLSHIVGWHFSELFWEHNEWYYSVSIWVLKDGHI